MNISMKYKVSLRITHPDIGSEKISSELGLVPKISYTVGDKKVTPKGGEIPGFRKETYWCHEFTIHEEPLEIALAKFNKILAEKKEFLARISETGGCSEYFIGWFLSKNSGFVLKHDFLQDCSNLKINLTFDAYP